MHTFIVLIRGVMPTGVNRLSMSRLREVLTAGGFGNVRTYIQSGNALVDTELSKPETAERIHGLIKTEIGPDLTVIAESPAFFSKVLAETPFGADQRDRTFYTFFASQPNALRINAASQTDYSPDRIRFFNSGAYVYVPGSFARSKINNNGLERQLNVTSTTRNGNTLAALVKLAGS